MLVVEEIKVASPGQDSGRGCRQPQLDQAVRRAFLTAILLTGSQERAEATLMETIRLWHTTEPLVLSRVAIRALTDGVNRSAGIASLSDAAAIVPRELRSVLDLPESARQCYVLRILNGLSRDDCADLLRVSSSEIDQQTCAALQRLSQPHSREQ